MASPTQLSGTDYATATDTRSGVHRSSVSPGASPPPGATSPGVRAGPALGLVALIVVTEYLARRVLAPSLPTIGAPVVNDMLATALAYGLLAAIVAPKPERSVAAFRRALGGILAGARTWLPWIGAVAFLGSVIVLTPLDAVLWGTVRLPSFTAPPSTMVLFASAATPLTVLSLLAVNGVVIPLAEERLWRGLIQPRLRGAWGLAPALLTTAVLFSLKHVVVDASPGRLLALSVGGLVLGVVAYRAGGAAGGTTGWRTSALSHMVGNLVATSLALASGLF
jgi:membrane protease YdiL (CAAX protease family)